MRIYALPSYLPNNFLIIVNPEKKQDMFSEFAYSSQGNNTKFVPWRTITPCPAGHVQEVKRMECSDEHFFSAPDGVKNEACKGKEKAGREKFRKPETRIYASECVRADTGRKRYNARFSPDLQCHRSLES